MRPQAIRGTGVNLNFDRLEPRRLLSAPAPVVQNGILKVWGTPGDDTIEITDDPVAVGMPATPAYYGVYIDGVTTFVRDTGIIGVHVHAGAGNDTIVLHGIDPVVLALPTAAAGVDYDQFGVGVAETVFGGAGDDSIVAGYGPVDGVSFGGGNGHPGCAAIHGGAGNDTISANDGTIYGGQGDDAITPRANTTVYSGLGNDNINPGSNLDPIFNAGGNDTVTGAQSGVAEPG